MASREPLSNRRRIQQCQNNKEPVILPQSMFCGNYTGGLGFTDPNSPLRRRFAVFMWNNKALKNDTTFFQQLIGEMHEIFMLLVSVGTYVDCLIRNKCCHASKYFSKQVQHWTSTTFNKSSAMFNFISDSTLFVRFEGPCFCSESDFAKHIHKCLEYPFKYIEIEHERCDYTSNNIVRSASLKPKGIIEMHKLGFRVHNGQIYGLKN